MYAYRMIVGGTSNFATEYNLPQQFRRLPLEIIILPMTIKETSLKVTNL